MKLYVASSWKNTLVDQVIQNLRAYKHDVYDFRATPGNFSWPKLLGWETHNLSVPQVVDALRLPEAREQFKCDKDALDWCEGGVLVLPSGRSAHLEAGYLIGQGKPVWVLLAEGDGIDLMHLLAGDNFLCSSSMDVVEAVSVYCHREGSSLILVGDPKQVVLLHCSRCNHPFADGETVVEVPQKGGVRYVHTEC